MREFDNKILIIGIGNSGRADDGLGWAFVDEVKDRLPESFDFEYRYQLQIEDAELIGHYARVYFVDADIASYEEGFRLSSCKPNAVHGFTTHELEPGTVAYLAEDLYNNKPEAFILGITGYNFELELGLSEGAKANLLGALKFFDEKILNLVI
ncbi:hydrogenase maturation protease [Flavobacteriaceae bacterium D16]|nr:hydrogenase maturation protease [Flavobacteriaceae bacterium D16]